MNNYAYPDTLVSTQWLADHLHDDNLCIVEVGMSSEATQGKHIAGAIFWNIFTDLLKPNHAQNLDTSAIAALLSRSGITPDTIVVTYGVEPGTSAWMFWLLTLVGHRNVRVLNGGWSKWLSENNPVSNTFSTAASTSYPETSLAADTHRISFSEIQSNFEQPAQILLDVRTLPEYEGTQYLLKPPEKDERAGHMPGAVHLSHDLVFAADSTFKPREEFKTLFVNAGVTPDKTVVTYCAIGARSACIWFVLKYLLGYSSVRNYDGSWNEWSRIPEAPIE